MAGNALISPSPCYSLYCQRSSENTLYFEDQNQKLQRLKSPELQCGPVLACLGLSHPPGCRRPPSLTTATRVLAAEVNLVFSKKASVSWQKGTLTSLGNERMKRIVREKDSEEETPGTGRGLVGDRTSYFILPTAASP